MTLTKSAPTRTAREQLTLYQHWARPLQTALAEVAHLEEHYETKLTVNEALGRAIVSYQANRRQPELRWCKYREGFSSQLVLYALDQCRIQGRVFDPFAGSGTTLFTAADRGLNATGIELLPNSIELMEVRSLIRTANRQALAQQVRRFAQTRPWFGTGRSRSFNHLRITAGAFPPPTETRIGRYRYEVDRLADETLRRVLRVALMGVLEDVSYTRKDGQYLRWDVRSGRVAHGSAFMKAHIHDFDTAVTRKLLEIADDLLCETFAAYNAGIPAIDITAGSCLDVLPQIEADTFDGIITSPPYCNRYDYTRTYALELAMLGLNNDQVKHLRQQMLTCTVENREKPAFITDHADPLLAEALASFNTQAALQSALLYLEGERAQGRLNNGGIPRMVRNYFKELALVMFECGRVLRPGSPFVMVNDNVRYQGLEIPVDLILSDFAEAAGFDVETIWVLPKGKGNSSQQMGRRGRQELRKCVIVWRKR